MVGSGKRLHWESWKSGEEQDVHYCAGLMRNIWTRRRIKRTSSNRFLVFSAWIEPMHRARSPSIWATSLEKSSLCRSSESAMQHAFKTYTFSFFIDLLSILKVFSHFWDFLFETPAQSLLTPFWMCSCALLLMLNISIHDFGVVKFLKYFHGSLP